MNVELGDVLSGETVRAFEEQNESAVERRPGFGIAEAAERGLARARRGGAGETQNRLARTLAR